MKISVFDDGRGLPSPSVIGSPFSSDESASGLGLFIVKSEIEAMSGKLSYRYENGSLFVLSLMLETN